MAFAHNPNPYHSLVFDILEAARSRVEEGSPPYGKLWDEPSAEESSVFGNRSGLTGWQALRKNCVHRVRHGIFSSRRTHN